MYYPPDIENLRNSDNDRYASIRDIIEWHIFDDGNYKIPLVLGTDGDNVCVVDIKQKSPIFIGDKGAPHTESLWNFMAFTALTRSPEQVKLILIDPLGVDLKFAEKLPHTIFYTHEPQEIIGALMLLEEEILERENTQDECTAMVVVMSNISMAYSIAPELQRKALEALFKRGSKVGLFSLSTLGLDHSRFCGDFNVERTSLPSKPIREPYERDVVGLVEEAAYRNRKIQDANLSEKYTTKVSEAKMLFEAYLAKKEEQGAFILDRFFAALKILSEYKKINTALIQRKLHIGYGAAAKIIDSLLALSLIKKNEDGARYYCINTDENELAKIVNTYIEKRGFYEIPKPEETKGEYNYTLG